MGESAGVTRRCLARLSISTILVFGVTAGCPTHASAQSPWSSVVWMWFSDNAVRSDTTTVFFGDGYGATYCIDSLNPTIREAEAPPVPPASFEVLFRNIPSRAGFTCYGWGLVRYDFYGYSGRTQIDTFRIAFINIDSAGATWRIRWPSASYLGARCDSIFLVDPTGKMRPSRIDMMAQDSLVLVAPGDSGIGSFLIFKYGSLIVDGVSERQPSVPAHITLEQNYPNPFNPGTTIRFRVPRQAPVTLAVYDILGRQITTLVERIMPPGEYTVSWDARDDPSGVYWYRLSTNDVAVTKMMVLMK